MPGETRFIYQFIVALALLADKGTARKVVVSDAWGPWLHGKDYKDKGKAIELMILDESFWSDLDLVCKIGEPLLITCRLFDKQDPIMGHIYGQMLKLDTEIENMEELNDHEQMRAEIREVWWRVGWSLRPFRQCAPSDRPPPSRARVRRSRSAGTTSTSRTTPPASSSIRATMT